ncbi:MAG: trypsin-like peptidase domain-containing protein, partial [Acidobacteriota bacterium]|nr:trypsin-like peptidase domain-containing protein [Acidobacteriota bacterium]
FAALAERVSPAVVSIEARSFETAQGSRRVDPFEFFFGPRRRDPEREQMPDEQEFRQESGGSGFVISSDGLVVTNNHVIDGADEILVHIGDRSYAAEVTGADEPTDLALLQLETKDEFAYLVLGDSQALRVGEWVMAIGSPQGLVGTVTVGVVSAKQRRINISPETSSFENFIQTDAAINFGNSGGPLMNLRGEVIGINTAINYGSENIGFAVPVNILKNILPQLKQEGRVRRGYLGIGVEDLDREAAEAFALESMDGAMVTQVQPGRPADKAGLEIGDIILKVDDHTVRNTRDLIDYVSAKGPDSTVKLLLLRDGEEISKQVKLDERPVDGGEAEEEEETEDAGIEWLGIRYQNLTPGVLSMHGLPENLDGVWVTAVSPRSPLYDEGVRARNVINVITEVNGRGVESVEEFEEIVEAAASGSRLRLYFRRFVNGQEVQPLFAFPSVP